MKEYVDGLDMKTFKHIKDISSYNSNYYIGFKGQLLYALSDDDDTTEWWVIKGVNSYYLGESYTSEGDLLHRFESRNT